MVVIVIGEYIEKLYIDHQPPPRADHLHPPCGAYGRPSAYCCPPEGMRPIASGSILRCGDPLSPDENL